MAMQRSMFLVLAVSSRPLLVAHLVLVAAIACLGCGPSGPAKVPSDSAKVMAKLGDAPVESVALFKKVTGDDATQIDAALDKVMATGSTVTEKINICRQTTHGVPAELHLAQPVEVGPIETTFGPPGLKTRRMYSVAAKELDFYTYGDLEVGVDDTKAIVVVVNK